MTATTWPRSSSTPRPAIAYAETVPDLRTNGMVTDAVCLQLGHIGELARVDRISQMTQDALPSVPWSELRGLRNRIFHDYGNVDVDVVIEVVQDDLPYLIAAINAALT